METSQECNGLPATLAAYLDEVYGVPEDPKQAFMSEHKARSSSSSDEEYGTKASGFAHGGPFSCKDCIHKQVVQGTTVCKHPKVNADPEVKGAKVGGFVTVGADDCCRYVRPK